MQQTTNLGLELYEPTDNANLLDGYNVSMRKIDAHEGTQDGLITLAQSTANNAAMAAATADGKATAAASAASDAATAASTADGKAIAAQTAAAQALTQLNNAHFYHLTNADRGNKWTVGSWASNLCEFNAMVVCGEDSGHGILIGQVIASSATSTPAQNTGYKLLQLSEWTVDTTYGATMPRVPGAWVSGAWALGETICELNVDELRMVPIAFPTGAEALGAREAFACAFVFPVMRKS